MRAPKLIVAKMEELFPSLDYLRVGINDVNNFSVGLINALWDTRVVFTVTSPNIALLDHLNFQMSNRSNSIDRWRVTPYGEFYSEPLDIIMCYKALSDEQEQKQQAKYLFSFSKDKTEPPYIYISPKPESTDSKVEA